MKSKEQRMARHMTNLQRARKSKVALAKNRKEQRPPVNAKNIKELLDLLR